MDEEVIKKFEYKRLSVTKYEFLVYFPMFSSEFSEFCANSSLFKIAEVSHGLTTENEKLF